MGLSFEIEYSIWSVLLLLRYAGSGTGWGSKGTKVLDVLVL